MLKTAAMVLVAIPVLFMGLALGSGCAVVDVRPADGPRIVVPVPLFAARTALAFAPEEARYVDCPELDEYADVAGQILAELMEAPDGVLVEVEDGSDRVQIEKIGDEIAIDVDTEDEIVSVTLPLDLTEELLDAFDGDRIRTTDVLAALSSVSRTDLVHVRTADEEVRVWIW